MESNDQTQAKDIKTNKPKVNYLKLWFELLNWPEESVDKQALQKRADNAWKKGMQQIQEKINEGSDACYDLSGISSEEVDQIRSLAHQFALAVTDRRFEQSFSKENREQIEQLAEREKLLQSEAEQWWKDCAKKVAEIAKREAALCRERVSNEIKCIEKYIQENSSNMDSKELEPFLKIFENLKNESLILQYIDQQMNPLEILQKIVRQQFERQLKLLKKQRDDLTSQEIHRSEEIMKEQEERLNDKFPDEAAALIKEQIKLEKQNRNTRLGKADTELTKTFADIKAIEQTIWCIRENYTLYPRQREFLRFEKMQRDLSAFNNEVVNYQNKIKGLEAKNISVTIDIEGTELLQQLKRAIIDQLEINSSQPSLMGDIFQEKKINHRIDSYTIDDYCNVGTLAERNETSYGEELYNVSMQIYDMTKNVEINCKELRSDLEAFLQKQKKIFNKEIEGTSYPFKSEVILINWQDEIKQRIGEVALAYKHVKNLATFLAAEPVQFLFQQMKAKDYQYRCNKAVEILFSHLHAHREMIDEQKQGIEKIEKINDLYKKYQEIYSCISKYDSWLNHCMLNQRMKFAERELISRDKLLKAIETSKTLFLKISICHTEIMNTSELSITDIYREKERLDKQISAYEENSEEIKSIFSKVRGPDLSKLYHSVSSFKELETIYQELVTPGSVLEKLHGQIHTQISEFSQNENYNFLIEKCRKYDEAEQGLSNELEDYKEKSQQIEEKIHSLEEQNSNESL